MTMVLAESPGSRSSSLDPPSARYLYKSRGEFNDSIVRQGAIVGTPYAVFLETAIVYRRNISLEPDGWAQYWVTVDYGPRNAGTMDTAGGTGGLPGGGGPGGGVGGGSHTFSFSTQGASVTVKAAKEHIQSYPAMSILPTDPHQGSIGVTQDGSVEGATITIPCLQLNYAYRHPKGTVNEALARRLARGTGKTNSDNWRGFAPGELLFAGSTGSDGSEADAEVTYSVLASENATGLSIGAITGIAKKGWEYLWVEFRKSPVGGYPGVKPRRVHVERVYDPISFEALFGWS